MLNSVSLSLFDKEGRQIISAYVCNPRDVLYLERIGERCSAIITTSGTQCHAMEPLPDSHVYIHGAGLKKSVLLTLISEWTCRQ